MFGESIRAVDMKIEKGEDALLRRHPWCPNDHHVKRLKAEDLKTEEDLFVQTIQIYRKILKEMVRQFCLETD